MRVLLAVLALAVCSFGQVTFDAVGPGSTGATINGTNQTLNWTHVTTGTNMGMVVNCGLSASSDAGYTLSATYNSVAMTAKTAIHSNNSTGGFLQQFTLLAPTTGSHTVSVVASGGSTVADLTCGSITMSGVDQVTGFRNFNSALGAGTTSSVTITSATNNMVVSAEVNGTALPTSANTVRWGRNTTNSTQAGNANAATAAGAASVVMSNTITSDSWAMSGIDVMAFVAGTHCKSCDMSGEI